MHWEQAAMHKLRPARQPDSQAGLVPTRALRCSAEKIICSAGLEADMPRFWVGAHESGWPCSPDLPRKPSFRRIYSGRKHGSPMHLQGLENRRPINPNSRSTTADGMRRAGQGEHPARRWLWSGCAAGEEPSHTGRKAPGVQGFASTDKNPDDSRSCRLFCTGVELTPAKRGLSTRSLRDGTGSRDAARCRLVRLPAASTPG